MHLRVFTACSGYDSQCMALDRLHEKEFFFSYELVGWSEIDKNAIKAHNAVYPQWSDRNYGDLSKIDWTNVPDFDLFTYSTPCQDFSQAGKQAGGTEGSGTRSSLLWECRKAIVAKRPKYLLMENVAALVSGKFIKLFNKWQLELEGYGYRNYAAVLNAKDYGVPQNRERIFMVSILDENARFEFPKPMRRTGRLLDFLDKEVHKRYYLSTERLAGLLNSTKKEKKRGNGFAFKPTDGSGVATTIQTSSTRKTDNYIIDGVQIVGNLQPDNLWGNSIRQQNQIIGTDGLSPAITAEHARHEFKIAEPTMVQQVGDRGNSYMSEKDIAFTISANPMSDREQLVKEPIIYDDYNQRFRADQQVIGTFTTNCGGEAPRNGFKILEPVADHKEPAFCNPYHINNQPYRVRKLTERECFRLMGVSESDIDKIQAAGISRTQQTHLAGNSIVVDVMYHIFNKLFLDTTITEPTLF